MRVTHKPGNRAALMQTVAALNGSTGRVGWFPSARYEGGQPVAGVAAVQEYGSPSRGIPPRLGMRETAEKKRGEWAETAAKISRAAVQGKINPNNIMDAVCMTAEGAMRQQITQVTSPPLKAATVAARKRRLADGGKSAQGSIAKPLVDTGIMLNTLTSEVEKK